MMDDLRRWWRSTLFLLQSRRDQACEAGRRTCGHCAAHDRRSARIGEVPQGPDAWAAAMERWAAGESLEAARARGRAIREETREQLGVAWPDRPTRVKVADRARLVVAR